MKTSPIAMFIVFAIGVGTGFLIAKRLLEDKYAQIAEYGEGLITGRGSSYDIL